ncbi:hypothetical protein VTO42DRAFT_5919 [Malbranchea cinnamomea]
MSSFVALNIEPDEETEEEIDDTKEIQIEEALKLYLTALKLHSQGEKYYPQAKEAYDALLNSEIFKYPESLSRYKRAQLHDPEDEDIDILDEEDPAGSAGPLESRDSTASALPQTIYLSFKNYGQFVLDLFRHSRIRADSQNSTDAISSAGSALKAFAEALERDETDLELWRKAARVGDALFSHRIARYCLESVIDGSIENMDLQFDQLTLERAFAVEGLRRIVNKLDDRLSESQTLLKRPRKAILRLLKAGTDPYPYLPSSLNDGNISSGPQKLLGSEPIRRAITPLGYNWADLGKAILQALEDEDGGATESASILEISLPAKDDVVTLPIQQKLVGEPNIGGPEESHEVEAVEVAKESTDTKDFQNLRNLQVKEDQDSSMVDDPDRPLPAADESTEVTGGTIAAEDGDSKTRKRRPSPSAGVDEPVDGGRTKSRRIRARESNADTFAQPEDIAFDQARYFEDRLELFNHADQWVFGTVGSLLSKLGVDDLGTHDELRQVLAPQNEQRQSSSESALPMANEAVVSEILRHTIETWDDDKALLALHSDLFAASREGTGGIRESALAIFQEHSRQDSQGSRKSMDLDEDQGLLSFCERINMGKYSPQEVSLQWLESHLLSSHQDFDSQSFENCITSSYATEKWTEAMKNVVNGILLGNDEFLYRRILDWATQLEEFALDYRLKEHYSLKSRHYASVEFSQTIYELHLDIYASKTALNRNASEIEEAVERDRLSRWRSVTQNLINHYLDAYGEQASSISIVLRHLWSTTLHLNLTEEADQGYVVLCLEDMKKVLTSLESRAISLINNETMPEISVAAVDKEVSKLKSKQFFMSIFGSDSNDPVHLIESIEPILDPAAIGHSGSSEDVSDEAQTNAKSRTELVVAQAREMTAFLDRSDLTLKLFLWRRLQEAYDSIEYPTKSISCRLRIIETIIEEVGKPRYIGAPPDHRRTLLLKWLRLIDKTLSKLVGQISNDAGAAFECFDMDHLRASMSAVARLTRVLHTFAMFEDAVKIGQVQPPEIRPASTAKTLEQFKERLRSMQVNAWIVQYFLLCEGIKQNEELFDTPLDDRIHYLRSVHNALGVRGYCKYSNKGFLKLMKEELLTLQTEDSYESDIAQVLFDLYGLKFMPNLDALDHSCPTERVDRHTAMMMVDFVILQANRLSIKDLSKSELKSTMDVIQKSIGSPAKTAPALALNKRVLSTYLKSPINPELLFRSVRGIGELSTVPVNTDFAKLAEKGWYFLLGSCALAKFKSQKRLGPISTEDLDLAASFFKLELELDSGKWETWYRLAQVYDLKLEEAIAWSAEKLNNRRAELASLQRKGIHAYAAAVAEAIRSGDSNPETKRKISELYTDFGLRIYASSREPLSMEAFDISDNTKHFSSGENQKMYTGKPFNPMSPYSAWKFASYLFRRAMVDRPRYWVNHYMFSKCLWKMFNSEEQATGSHRTIEPDDILESLLDAIDSLPQKKDPVLEPHFKFVSVIHKLVKRGILQPRDASERLLATPWGKNLSAVDEMTSWKPFILDVLKNLQNADKANWHHRIVARAARVIYDDARDSASALAAKQEFTQHIFTKVMTMQIWRPENERGGRHFVYTTRYAYFFIELLNQLRDRTSLELLIRRVRKKPHDFLNYNKLWEDACSTYIKLVRDMVGIPTGHEETIFKPMTLNEFLSNAARLETLCHTSDADSALVDALREAVDLKKLNGTLMKAGMFEDLVADTYALLFERNLEKFAEQATEEENRERMKVDHVLTSGNDADGTRTPTTSVPGPKPRVKGVTKKELQRKADAIALKAAASRQAGKAVRAPDECARPSTTDGPSEEQAPSKEDTKEDAPAVQSSVPASLHDSADDESELSELDDEKFSEPAKPRPMFPNLLVKRLVSPKPSEPSTNISLDGGDAESGPTASFHDAKSDAARPSDDAMDIDG